MLLLPVIVCVNNLKIMKRPGLKNAMHERCNAIADCRFL